MTKLTKEQQLQAIYDLKVGYTLGHADIAMLKSMARQLLAGIEQEPVAFIARYESGAIHGTCDRDDPVKMEWLKRGMAVSPLYAAPQLPQPAVVDDDKFRADFERWMVEEERCIVGSSDPYPAGIESRNWRAWNACRAAMLQGAEPGRQPLAFFDGDISPEDAEKIIARLREMNRRPGSQQVMIAEPVSQPYKLRDGWVACSERMPEAVGEFVVYETLNNKVQHDYWNLWNEHGNTFAGFWNHHGEHVTHWMPLPSAPQQECKHEFVYGWHSYGRQSGYQCRFCGKVQGVK